MERCAHPADRIRELFPARDPVTGHPFTVGECHACGLAVTRPPLSPEALRAYYPPAYHRAAGARRFLAVVEWGQRRVYALRARRVERLAGGKPGRVLDVGCGPGALLGAFARRGWEVHGTELDDRAAAAARAAGVQVHVGALEEAPWPAGHFDAIVLWHALEHFADPLPPLEQAHRLLRPGGVLMAGVPNFGSPEARLAKGGWFHLDVPRHLTHFTPASLGAAVRAAGLEVVRASFLAVEYDTFSLVQSTLNVLGLRPNALYDLLRTRSARLAAGAGRSDRLVSLALAPPLALVAFPASLVLAAAGLGSSLTLHAIKAR